MGGEWHGVIGRCCAWVSHCLVVCLLVFICVFVVIVAIIVIVVIVVIVAYGAGSVLTERLGWSPVGRGRRGLFMFTPPGSCSPKSRGCAMARVVFAGFVAYCCPGLSSG